jgi:hypothetical protein
VKVAAVKKGAKAKKAKAPVAAPPVRPEMTETASTVLEWILSTSDNRGMPFAIIDKSAARVFVYDVDGTLKGTTAALIGSAVGDFSTPGVGDRELSDIAPEERTTPAGRYVAAYGPAVGGQTVLWVDYHTAISLHPVVTTNKTEQRMKRLASETVEDNRITFGCINVTPTFYRKVVRPTFKAKGNGVVYVLPDVLAVEQALPGFSAWPGATLLAERRSVQSVVSGNGQKLGAAVAEDQRSEQAGRFF